jgi:hypothetical protein
MCPLVRNIAARICDIGSSWAAKRFALSRLARSSSTCLSATLSTPRETNRLFGRWVLYLMSVEFQTVVGVVGVGFLGA